MPLPTEWDSANNIAWKVSIPGRGFSSPIVSGDSVYVSTAYAKDGVSPKTAAGAALLVAAVLLTAAALRDIAGRSRDPGPLAFAVAVALLSILCLEWVVIASGETLLDFARCPIRGWLASAGMATLVFASVLLTDVTRPARVCQIVAGIALSAVILLGVPTREYAFRGGLISANTSVMLAAAAAPLALSSWAAWTLLPRGRARTAIAVLALMAAATAMVGLARQLLVSGGGTLPEPGSLSARLGVTAIAADIGFAIVAVLGWRFRRHRPGRVAAVAGASAVFLCSALILLDRFAARSPFLTYHMGSPRLTIMWPSAVSMALGVVLLGAVPGRWLRNAAIAVAALFVLRTTVFQAESKMVRALLSINRTTGQVVWTAEAFLEADEAVDRRNSPATPTPVTDGGRIYAYFGNAGLMCVSRAGAVLWTRTGRHYEGVYGIGFSPVLSKGTIVLGGSTNGRAEITAVDARSGGERWKAEFFAPARASGNNRTSLIERIGGRDVVLFWDQALIGLDLATGRTLWRHEEFGGDGDLVASLVSDDDRVYLVAAEGTRAFNRADLELPNAAERWKAPARANCVSPVLCGSRLLAVTDHGVLTAVDRNSGVLAWRHRLPGDYLASPIAADGLAYFTNTEGTTTVITCEGTPRVVAENHLDEAVTASAAAADGEMYVRTASALYCIREEHKSH